MQVFDSLNKIKFYQATAVRHGLALYVKTGLKPNTAWTPKAMLRTASHITGKAYKRGQYELAISDLGQWVKDHAS